MSSTPAHLNFITGNKNKLAEVQAILAGVIELRNENIDLVEIQGSVEDVTTDKARRAAEAVRSRFHPFIVFIILKRVVIDQRPSAG
jgi:inosine triphosphate pyrophosphatase